jgi:hypothetical protein
VTAQFYTDPPSVADHTECQGVDGMYDSFHYVYSGTETSGYALLSGDVTFELFGLTNVTTNDGYMSGTWTLTDPNTGQLKGKGHIDAVTSGVDTKGVIVGSLGTSGVTLVANYASVTSSQNTLSGEFGAAPSIIDLDPAVMAKGSCR